MLPSIEDAYLKKQNPQIPPWNQSNSGSHTYYATVMMKTHTDFLEEKSCIKYLKDTFFINKALMYTEWDGSLDTKRPGRDQNVFERAIKHTHNAQNTKGEIKN